MKRLIKAGAVLLAVLFPLIIFVSGIQVAVFDKGFYMEQMNKNEVAHYSGIYPDDMEMVVEEIIDYLGGGRKDFDIQARLASQDAKDIPEPGSIFNEKEIVHMDDVRDLLYFALLFRNMALVLALISFLCLLKYDKTKIVTALFWGSFIFILLFLFIGSNFIFNFNNTFTLFHQIFFRNDLWLMDPTTDRLIWIVPEPFFFAMITRMVIYTLVPLGLFSLVTGGVVLKKRLKKRN